MEERLTHQVSMPVMAQFERAFSDWVIKLRWWIIVVTLVVVLGLASGIRFLTVSNNTRVYFSRDNPQLQALEALEALENTFSKDTSIFYVLAPPDGNVFTRKTLQAVAELTETSWQMPYSSRVNSVTNFQHTRSEADDLIVEDLVGEISGLSGNDLSRIKGIALSEPQLVNRLISPSGHVTGVYVTVRLPGESLQEVPEVVDFARRKLSAMRKKYHGIHIYLTGGVMIDYTFGEASRRDLSTLIPLMILILVALVGLSLRSFWGTFCVSVIILISMITGLGLAIAREADRRDMGFGDITVDMQMILMNRHGQKSERKIRIHTLEVEGDGDKSLTIFDTPRDIKGTAFLSYTHKVGDDDQWLYLPALKRVKRISSRNKSGSFMGSEFSYEDIASQEVEKYTYKWLRDEHYEGLDCFVVELVPIDKKNSGYIKQIIWRDKQTYRLCRAEYYDRKKSLLKTLKSTGYQKYLDQYWRPDEMLMVNHQTGKSTRLIMSNYRFRTGLNDRDFNQNSLRRAR